MGSDEFYNYVLVCLWFLLKQSLKLVFPKIGNIKNTGISHLGAKGSTDRGAKTAYQTTVLYLHTCRYVIGM